MRLARVCINKEKLSSLGNLSYHIPRLRSGVDFILNFVPSAP